MRWALTKTSHFGSLCFQPDMRWKWVKSYSSWTHTLSFSMWNALFIWTLETFLYANQPTKHPLSLAEDSCMLLYSLKFFSDDESKKNSRVCSSSHDDFLAFSQSGLFWLLLIGPMQCRQAKYMDGVHATLTLDVILTTLSMWDAIILKFHKMLRRRREWDNKKHGDQNTLFCLEFELAVCTFSPNIIHHRMILTTI